MFALVYTLNDTKLQISLRICFGRGKKLLILFYFMNFSSKKPFPQAF